MTAVEIVRLLLIAISLLAVLVLAVTFGRHGGLVLGGRGEVAGAPDEGEACTDPVADPVVVHADETLAAVDEREIREHFARWEQEMGADR